MQVLEWLDENELRHYPLAQPATYFSMSYTGNATIEGTRVNGYEICGVVLDARLYFNTGNCVLTSLNITDSGSAVFTVSSQLESNSSRTFTVPDYLNASYPYYCRNGNELLVIGEVLTKLNLALNTTLTFDYYYFEPSVCLLKRTGVTLMHHNGSGIVDASAGVSDIPTAGVSGVVVYEEGPFCGFTVTESTNTLTVTADRNSGLPQNCSDMRGQGVVDCVGAISSINGVTLPSGEGNFIIAGGDMVSVFEEALPTEKNGHSSPRIYIGLTGNTGCLCKTQNKKPYTSAML